MNGTPPPVVAAGKPVLFEVNLIRDRIDSLRRRRRMQNLSVAASLLMLLAGGAIGVVAGMNLTENTRQAAALKSEKSQFADAKLSCKNLDTARDKATEEIAFVTPLLTVAKKRVDWCTKLGQFATAIGPGGGVQMVAGSSGDVYTDPPADAKVAIVVRTSDLPSFSFAVVAPADQAPRLNSFTENLNSLPGFVKKIGPAQTESITMDPADAGATVTLRGSCKTGGLQR